MPYRNIGLLIIKNKQINTNKIKSFRCEMFLKLLSLLSFMM